MEKSDSNEQTSENSQETIFTPDEFSLQGYDKHIRQARNAIFVAAGILAISLLVLAANAPKNYEFLWLDITIWGLFILGFIAMGFWTKRKPYNAIIGALILYSLFIILNAAVDITTLYKGIIFKVIIIVLLVKGLRDAREAQEMKKQLER